MRFIKFAFIAYLLFVAASIAHAQESAAKIPLTLIERSPAEPPPSAIDGTDRWVRYVYRNDGDRAITAWDHRCIFATHSGRTGWTSEPHDAFSMLLIHPVESAQRRVDRAVVEPGETVEELIGHPAGSTDGPFAAQTCGPVAVIFADGTHAGASQPLEDFFSRRRALVNKLRYLMRRLDERLAGPADERPAVLEATLAFAESLSGVYVSRVAHLRAETQRSQRDRRLRDLRAVVGEDYSRALGHLRPIDREIVERGQP